MPGKEKGKGDEPDDIWDLLPHFGGQFFLFGREKILSPKQ